MVTPNLVPVPMIHILIILQLMTNTILHVYFYIPPGVSSIIEYLLWVIGRDK